MGDEAPIALAFGAGLVASVNPCGFAMLPAFVGYYLGSGVTGDADRGSAADGLTVALVVTAGFLAVFAIVGGAFALGARAVVRYVPWVTIVVGAGLVLLGLWLAAGKQLAIRLPGVAARAPGGGGLRSMFAFGLAYAVGSLSCTLPVFLVVVGGGLAAGSILGTFVVFLAYGLGMATVLMLLCLGTASFREVLVRRVRRVLPYVGRASGGLLVAGGAYVVYYWASVLSGASRQGPVRWVSDLQQRAQDLVLGLDERVWFVVGVVLFIGVGIAFLRASGKRSDGPGNEALLQDDLKEVTGS